jgi:nucleotide-binding universal stress UspA family protein
MASLQSGTHAVARRTFDANSPDLKVLAVIDGSERTGRVIDYARRLKCRGHGLHVVVLGVVPEPATGRLRGYGSFKQAEVYGGLKERMRQRAVSAAARRLDQEKIAHDDRIEIGDPVATILRVAREEHAELILLGDTPPGIVQRMLPTIGLSLVTITNLIVQRATVPVVVVK